MSWSDYCQNGITYMAIGAGIGGFIGVINVARNSFFVTDVSNDEFDAYPNIKLDSHVSNTLSQFKAYKPLAPTEYKLLLENLNALIGLQVAVNQNNIQLQYAFQSTNYVTKIQQALFAMKHKLRNTSVPSFDTDEALLRQMAEDHSFNITQAVNQYMLNNTQPHATNIK